MKKKSIVACVAVALSCMSATAAAVPLSMSGSIGDGAFLQAGQRTGTFTASGLPDYYQINSASFSFTFNDDGDGWTNGPMQQIASSYGAYSLTQETQWVNKFSNTQIIRDFYRYGTRSQSFQRKGQQEGVALTLGGIDAGSGSTTEQSETRVSRSNDSLIDQSFRWGPQGNYSCGNRCTAYGPLNTDYYWSFPDTTTTTYITDWTGGFTIAGTITDRSVLDTLHETGLLSFNLDIAGDLFLSSSQINLDYTELAPPPSGAVPEPSTLWLLAGALGALGYNRRRKANRR
jgi:hypothetical protein